MPNIKNITIEIRTENTPNAAQDVTPLVHKLLYKDSVLTGSVKWEMVIGADFINSEEDKMFSQDPIWLRLSMTKDRAEETTDWKKLIVEKSSIEYVGGMPIVHLYGSNAVSLLKSSHKWRAFKETSASSIVEYIAAENGLTAVTDLATKGTWYQIGQTDWEFLQQIKNETITLAGQRNAFLWIDNNVLYMIPIDFSSPPIRDFNIGHGDDRTESILYNSYFRESSYRGGNYLFTSGFDALNKKYIESPPKDEIIPLLAGKISLPFGEIQRYQTTFKQTEEEIRSIGTVDWIDSASKNFSVHLKLSGDVTLRVGSIINVAMADTDGNESSMSGKYPVYELIHYFTNSPEKDVRNWGVYGLTGLTTHVAGFRRSFYYGEEESIGTNTSDITKRDPYSALNLTPNEAFSYLTSEELP